MWHVDDGALHAYLDGALDEYPAAEARRVREHLETCSGCAERLAGERRVREKAQDILSLASPRVEIPTLEELRAYVKAQQPPHTKARIRLYRLSWAASVVLALGTGWMLRGGVPQPAAFGDRGLTGSPSAAPAPEPAAQRSAAELDLSSEAVPGLDAGPVAAEPATSDAVVAPARSAPTPATAAAPPPSDPAPSAQRAAGLVVAGEPQRELAERRGESVPERAGVVASAAPAHAVDAMHTDAAASRAADDAAADLLAANTGAPAPQAAAAGVPEEPLDTPSTTAERAMQDTAPRDAAGQRAAEQRLQSAITGAPTATGLPPGAPLVGRAAGAPAEASVDSAETEPVSLVVPGLEVIDVLRIGEGTTFLGTRALQLLPTGDTLETAHLPPGVEPTVLPPLRAGWTEMIQPQRSGWLVMRARLSPAELAELLQRLESGR
jgi:hypothetical protein